MDSGKDARTGTGGEPHDTAARIVSEVRHAARSGQTTLTKVTSLTHAFRGSETSVGIDDVMSELRRQDLRVKSGWDDAKRPNRTGVLELSVANGSEEPPVSAGCDDTIRVSEWSTERVTFERPLPDAVEPATPSVVRWFDVDPPSTPFPCQTRNRFFGDEEDSPGVHTVRDAPEPRVHHVWRALSARCTGLTEEMIRDLLRADLHPKVETYGNEKDGVRSVSVAAVIARELPSSVDSDGVSEALVFQLVEILVGDGWLVTCWHPSRTFRGSSEEQPGPHVLRETFNSHVRHRWLATEPKPPNRKTSGDLGLYLARSLADTYGASYRMMERWVEAWEINFFKSLNGQPDKASRLKEAAKEISNSLSMAAEFRRRISALEHARWLTSDKSWFPRLSDHGDSDNNEDARSEQSKALEASIDSEQTKLEHLTTDIRADIDLLMLQSAGLQQALSERLQERLGWVTGLVLVPTLIVGIFGANTELPGRDHWLGFGLMFAFMVISGIAVWFSIRRLTNDNVV